MNEKYEKILFRPHHISGARVRMAESDRAAQFAPYAALSGYEEEVCEEARITEKRMVLDDSEVERLDGKLRILSEFPDTEAVITYFVNDRKKTGGAYFSKCGYIKIIDSIKRQVVFTDGSIVPINNITDIEIH